LSLDLPLIRFVRQVRRTRDVGAATFLSLVALVALLALATPLSARTAALMMSRFHLRVQPFAVWAALQPIPSMYNFENRYWVSPRPLRADELEILPAPADVEARYINHYPLRVMTWAEGRAVLLAPLADRWVYARTCYRGACVRSAFHVSVQQAPPAGVVVSTADAIQWPDE